MLTHPLLDKLRQLRCQGMLESLQEQLQQPDMQSLNFEDRVALMVDREWWLRENNRIKTRLKNANLRQTASMEVMTRPEASQKQLCKLCLLANGSENIKISFSWGQQEQEKVLLPQPRA